MKLRRIAFLGSLLLAALLAGAGNAGAAEAAPTVMFLLDGSGSMWGKLGTDKRAKFDFARDALRQTFPRIKPDVRVGIASFGHRRKGSCGDAEVIVPLEPSNPERLMAPLDKLNATGKGPLVQGLREAAAAIGTAAPASIVLIYDDVDNCGQDVCAAADAIAKANPRLSVYAIGLGLDKAKLQQMSCVAALTGGKLYDAQDAAGMASALDRIVALANLVPSAEPETAMAAKEAPAETSASAPAADAPPGLYLTAGLGPESATLESPLRWRVTKAGSDGELIREARAPALIEKLSPGAYEVEARLGLAAARQSVDVKADAPTPVRVNLNAGILKMLARPAKDAAPLQGPVFTVTALSDDEAKAAAAPLWIGREAQPEIVLPAGEYRISAENGLARQQQTVKIAAATGTTFDAMLATGRLELSATRGSGADLGEALTDGVTFIVYEDDPESTAGRREVTRSAAPSPAFTLPAGTYYVTARTAGAEAREQIAIGAGGVVRRALPLALARLKLSATLDGAPPPEGMPIAYSVIRLDGEPREVLRTVASEPELELSAGRYRLEASLGASNVKAAAEIALTAGQSQTAVLKLEAGHVTLMLAGGLAPAAGDVFWEVEDGQRTVLRTSQPQPAALLAPGRYVVTAQTRDREFHGAIEVKAGEQRAFEIGGI
jgi:Ca-activated chloride channel family protein